VLSACTNLYIIWQPEHGATDWTGRLWNLSQEMRAIVLYQTKHHTCARITGDDIANLDVSAEMSLFTTTWTHHVYQCVSLCGKM
jgi:hypothetical protein